MAAVVWGGAVLWHGGKSEPSPRAFSGIRQELSGAEFTEQDPASGRVLVVRAARSTVRDGTVGRLFQTPLRPRVLLEGVRIELRNGGGVRILTARAARGRLDPKGRRVSLDSPWVQAGGGCELRPRLLTVGADGRLELQGPVEVWRNGRLVEKRAGLEGWVEHLGCPDGG